MDQIEKSKRCCCGHSERVHNMGYRGWMAGLLTQACMVWGCGCRQFHEAPSRNTCDVDLNTVRRLGYE